jgi:septal ring factor EnvC (AmiA/AmiB activator)
MADNDEADKYNGRVTTKQFFEELLTLTESISKFRCEILESNGEILSRLDNVDRKLVGQKEDRDLLARQLAIVANLARENANAVLVLSERL